MPEGTLRAILRQAGVDPDEFLKGQCYLGAARRWLGRVGKQTHLSEKPGGEPIEVGAGIGIRSMAPWAIRADRAATSLFHGEGLNGFRVFASESCHEIVRGRNVMDRPNSLP